LAEFEKTGYIRWVSDLAKIPQEHGVNNVYGEVGTAFATTCVTSPRFCAAMMGTLIKGSGTTTWCGEPTRCCTDRRNGRSKRFGGSRSRTICKRSSGLPRSERRTAC